MADERLFDIEEIPEVPLFRAPRRSRGENDARFRNDYPAEWDRCLTCDGTGRQWRKVETFAEATRLGHAGIEVEGYGEGAGEWFQARDGDPCADCLGMGSLKARVRLEAGHRCVRCKHPYMPKGDAKMLGLEPSGLHDCETCGATGRLPDTRDDEWAAAARTLPCPACKGTGRRWTPWSECDVNCRHAGPYRAKGPDRHWQIPDLPNGGADEFNRWTEYTDPRDVATAIMLIEKGWQVEAEWRILTVHHLDGDKANVRWWNLMAACQRCHLEVQAKVVMERIYPHEHSEWFKPYVAGYYAFVYLGEDLDRPQVEARMDELLGLELITA